MLGHVGIPLKLRPVSLGPHSPPLATRDAPLDHHHPNHHSRQSTNGHRRDENCSSITRASRHALRLPGAVGIRPNHLAAASLAARSERQRRPEYHGQLCVRGGAVLAEGDSRYRIRTRHRPAHGATRMHEPDAPSALERLRQRSDTALLGHRHHLRTKLLFDRCVVFRVNAHHCTPHVELRLVGVVGVVRAAQQQL